MAAARLISSRWTLVTKWLPAFAAIAAPIGYATTRWPEGGLAAPMTWMFFVLFPLVLIANFLFSWNAADKVEDAGDRLRLSRRGVDAVVLLGDVEAVSISVTRGSDKITLRLRSPGPFGNRVSFFAKRNPLGRFGRNLIYQDLRERVERARARA